ncbi:vasopressin receptor [Mactra antiquata]
MRDDRRYRLAAIANGLTTAAEDYGKNKTAFQTTTIRALVNAAWILSGVLAIPSFVLFDTVQLNNETHCIMTLQEPWHWRLYVTLAALTAFVIPAIIIIVCYSIIIFVIWDKGRGFSSAFQPPSCRNHMPCGKQEILVSLRRHSGGNDVCFAPIFIRTN